MPEMTPIWIDGYYDTQAEAVDAIREGFEGIRLEVVPWPVLTLDQIEEWLTSAPVDNAHKRHFKEALLAQVQAMKEGA
jgi:hypothetical protein